MRSRRRPEQLAFTFTFYTEFFLILTFITKFLHDFVYCTYKKFTFSHLAICWSFVNFENMQPAGAAKKEGRLRNTAEFELLLLGAPGRRVSVQLLQQRMSRGSPECGAPAGGCWIRPSAHETSQITSFSDDRIRIFLNTETDPDPDRT